MQFASVDKLAESFYRFLKKSFSSYEDLHSASEAYSNTTIFLNATIRGAEDLRSELESIVRDIDDVHFGAVSERNEVGHVHALACCSCLTAIAPSTQLGKLLRKECYRSHTANCVRQKHTRAHRPDPPIAHALLLRSLRHPEAFRGVRQMSTRVSQRSYTGNRSQCHL